MLLVEFCYFRVIFFIFKLCVLCFYGFSKFYFDEYIDKMYNSFYLYLKICLSVCFWIFFIFKLLSIFIVFNSIKFMDKYMYIFLCQIMVCLIMQFLEYVVKCWLFCQCGVEDWFFIMRFMDSFLRYVQCGYVRNLNQFKVLFFMFYY